jgi:hypothetical protein
MECPNYLSMQQSRKKLLTLSRAMNQISALLLDRLHHHINFGKEREKTAASAYKEKRITK